MKVRHFGALLLALVGVLPLAVAGVSMVRRAERTALGEVRLGNGRVAARAASRLAAYVDTQVALLETLAASLAPAVRASPEQAERILKNYRINFEHLRSLDAIGPGCHELATSRLDGVTRGRCGEPAVEAALKGQLFRGPVTQAPDFAPVMTVGVPLELGAEPIGAVVAEINLEGIWEAVSEVRVGATGHARLVGEDDTLVGHGDPEERRRVFLRERDPFAPRVRAAGAAGARYRDSQGREVIAVGAAVPGLGWTVIVEQPIVEAYSAAVAMRRDLWLLVAAAACAAVALGLATGQGPVRALEKMRRHVLAVARGERGARLELPRLGELKALAQSLNDMTSELARLEDEIRAKERLSTFARVAAGLAHDLQLPIETVRGACDLALARPDDPDARELLRSAASSHLPRLHRYVRDLRRLAREGDVPLELASVDPAAVARQVAADAAAAPKWSGVEIAACGAAERVWADESLLVRALTNLVANAADACVGRAPPGGKVTIRVRDLDGGARVELAVEDSGPGIAPARLRALLAGDFHSTKRVSGVGLGLGVARHIMAAHGGTVAATSEEGRGSTFSITLPRQAASGVGA